LGFATAQKAVLVSFAALTAAWFLYHVLAHGVQAGFLTAVLRLLQNPLLLDSLVAGAALLLLAAKFQEAGLAGLWMLLKKNPLLSLVSALAGAGLLLTDSTVPNLCIVALFAGQWYAGRSSRSSSSELPEGAPSGLFEAVWSPSGSSPPAQRRVSLLEAQLAAVPAQERQETQAYLDRLGQQLSAELARLPAHPCPAGLAAEASAAAHFSSFLQRFPVPFSSEAVSRVVATARSEWLSSYAEALRGAKTQALRALAGQLAPLIEAPTPVLFTGDCPELLWKATWGVVAAGNAKRPPTSAAGSCLDFILGAGRFVRGSDGQPSRDGPGSVWLPGRACAKDLGYPPKASRVHPDACGSWTQKVPHGTFAVFQHDSALGRSFQLGTLTYRAGRLDSKQLFVDSAVASDARLLSAAETPQDGEAWADGSAGCAIM
jgi:hypothetical protein